MIYNFSTNDSIFDNNSDSCDEKDLKTEAKSNKAQEDLDSMLKFFEQDKDFSEQLLVILEEAEDLDLTKVQSKIILLLQKFSTKYSDKLLGKFKFDEDYLSSVRANIRDLSYELMQKSSKAISCEFGDMPTNPERLYSLNKDMSLRVKKLMKQFAIYEMYKAINPNRIAGESKLDNFISNAILRGVKSAKSYAGSKFVLKNKEIRKYVSNERQKIIKDKNNKGIGR